MGPSRHYLDLEGAAARIARGKRAPARGRRAYLVPVELYADDQPRDAGGRWTEGGGVIEGEPLKVGLGDRWPTLPPHPSSGWRMPASTVKLPDGTVGRVHSYGDAVPGGYNGGWKMTDASGKEMGYLEYQSATHGDGVTIAMVETKPEFRGRGVANALLMRLREEFPGKKIDPGMRTELGGAWWNKVRKFASARGPEAPARARRSYLLEPSQQLDAVLRGRRDSTPPDDSTWRRTRAERQAQGDGDGTPDPGDGQFHTDHEEAKRVAAILAMLFAAAARNEAIGVDQRLAMGIDASTVEEIAVRVGRERAAELMGLKVAADGSFVADPTAEQAITVTTEKQVNQVVDDALAAQARPVAVPDGATADEVDTSPSWASLFARLMGLYAFASYRPDVVADTETDEMGTTVQLLAWQDAGVEEVDVSDGELWDEPCIEANGQRWTIEQALDNPKEHPYCQRTFSPVTPVGDLVGAVGDFLNQPVGAKLALVPEAMAGEWDESLHPRDDAGKFADAAGGGGSTSTPAFKNWFGGSKVVDEEGKPLVVYHGTTHDFSTFQEHKGTEDSYLGAALYFSGNPTDASENYAGVGPDLTQRIETRADQLVSEHEDSPAYGTKEYDDLYNSAREMAKQELVGEHGGAVLPVYLHMENPVVLEKNGGTTFTIDHDEETGEESGNGLKLYQAILDTGEKYGFDGQKVWEKVAENGLDGTTAWEVDKALRESGDLMDATDENGNLVSGRAIRTIWEESGHDGVVMDAFDAFGRAKMPGGWTRVGMEGVTPGTKHYIVFKPTQIKSAIGNKGTFDPKNPHIGMRAGEGVALYAEDQPRDEGGRWTDGGGGAPLWHQEKPTGYDRPSIDAREAWTQSMLGAVSLGQLSPEEADRRGLSVSGSVKPDDWKSLPETLYHVTTAADAVERDGLKSRYELSQQSGHGLGGGDDKSISFTADPKVAEDIMTAFREAHGVAAGDKDIREMMDEAKEGGYLANVMRLHGVPDWKTGDPIPLALDAQLRGVMHRQGDFGKPPTYEYNLRGERVETPASVWKPMESGGSWEGAGGKKFYHYYERPATEEERRESRFEFYKGFAAMREHATGRLDPLFFASDAKALAAMDPIRDVAVMEYKPQPGAKGTQQSALGEWRTYTGKAVKFISRRHAGGYKP